MTEIPQEDKELKENIAKFLYAQTKQSFPEPELWGYEDWESAPPDAKKAWGESAEQILSVAMPLIEKRAREEIAHWLYGAFRGSSYNRASFEFAYKYWDMLKNGEMPPELDGYGNERKVLGQSLRDVK